MLNKLTTLIREDYLNLEKKKNERTNIEIQLYRVQQEIAELEKNVAKLENDRDFYMLVSLYNVYKNYDFPQDILEIVIKRRVFVSGKLCFCYTVSDITFGEWLNLWKRDWNYNGNPITFSLNTISGGYIEYWDLFEQRVITIQSKSYIYHNFEQYQSTTKSSEKNIKDIVSFIQKNLYK